MTAPVYGSYLASFKGGGPHGCGDVLRPGVRLLRCAGLYHHEAPLVLHQRWRPIAHPK